MRVSGRMMARAVAMAAVLVAGATAAQLRTDDRTDDVRDRIAKNCAVPASMVQVFRSTDGGQRVVRSPSLTPAQADCVDGNAGKRVRRLPDTPDRRRSHRQPAD